MSEPLSLEKLGQLFNLIDSNDTAKLSELAHMAGLSLAEDYIGADLSGEDLSGDKLSNANLEGADLSNAVLSNTDLKGANLSNAVLNNANLEGANLSNAVLNNANLEGANLSNAVLNNANLEGANLSSAVFYNANLEGANLNSAVFHNTNLEAANVNNVIFHNSNLEVSNINNINSQNTQVYGTILEEGHNNISLAPLARSPVLGLDAFEGSVLELCSSSTEDDLEVIIRALYKQVLGNQYVLENDRLYSNELALKSGDITVREFVRQLAKSELYRSLFFYSSSPYRFIELNFKHLLGRAPQSQSEIAEHVAICNTYGYDAEIDSYIDSDEYINSFGDNKVPYLRGIRSQVGFKNESFNRMFSLFRGPASNDNVGPARLITSIAANASTPINPSGVGNDVNSPRLFRITYSSSNRRAVSFGKFGKHQVVVVPSSQISQRVQAISRGGGTVFSVTQIV